MTDYLAEAQERMGGRTAAEAWAAVSTATDIRRLADAVEGIAAQHAQAVELSAAAWDLTKQAWENYKPEPATPSLVALDRAEEQEDIRGALLRWRAADRLFDPDCREWQDETHRLRDLADRIGLAR